MAFFGRVSRRLSRVPVRRLATISLSKRIDAATKAFQDADAVLITAGAGMGVDSGLPDFRGNEGFWKAYPALKGSSFVDMANPRGFTQDIERAWGFYGHRQNMYTDTTPHRGFNLLLEICQRAPLGGFVFTSNVDGQFQKAGFSENQVLECHGSINYLQCLHPGQCGGRNGLPLAEATLQAKVQVNEPTLRADPTTIPTCPNGCGGPARPAILMFGDGHWEPERTLVQEEHMSAWFDTILDQHARLVVVELGAGTAVPTVRATSERMARLAGDGATLIRINKRESDLPNGWGFPSGISLDLGALDALTAVLDS